MADLMTKIRKAIEDTLDAAKGNAQNLKEIAQDYGKTARLKFELHQLKISKRKKYELLGKTVFPYLAANDYKGLKKHETLSVLLDDIKNIINEIQLTQNELEQHLKNKGEGGAQESKEKIKEEILQIESEIESRLEEIKKIQEETGEK
ncbi:hypothetical protein [Caldithrix abyssi]|uniref:Uncharacterized protein n=1 Tax=Caldithrix abyssi DSM 13497 TaxID=880073 RepID=H1XX41_CALAY|nr:hypothetical protein [Caldithrix abyssi]APF20723.1 hypothetical protein Cabys_3978 [Caldithrix abyssi DSM 13497]EHO40778.1 hypothetical protein Calab_1150 [Caldithrix abyssi DSM 13497]